jgi:hypothetical protein
VKEIFLDLQHATGKCQGRSGQARGKKGSTNEIKLTKLKHGGITK